MHDQRLMENLPLKNQDVSTQRDALRRAGCLDELIFMDTASGARAARPSLKACLQVLRPGDTLIVWRLDRLGRSMAHLVTLIEELLRRRVRFRSLCDGAIDTKTASGEPVFNIFSAFGQFERWLIQERTRAGLAAARAHGRKGGRKPLSPHTPRVGMAKMMHADHRMTMQEMCQTLNVSRATLYRYIALARQVPDPA